MIKDNHICTRHICGIITPIQFDYKKQKILAQNVTKSQLKKVIFTNFI